MEEQLSLFDQISLQYGWLIKVAVILLITFCLSYLEKIVFYRLLPKYKRSGKAWDIAFLKAFYMPLKVLIWLLGITFAIEEAGQAFQHEATVGFIGPLRNIGIVAIAVWFCSRFIREMEKKFLKKKAKDDKLDKTMIKGIGLLLRIVVLIIAILILMQMVFHVPLSGVLVFGGLSGVVAGFAGKDLLANFFGGFVIFLDRPFVIGDWIRSPDREIEGYVEDIGWRLTKIMTFDKRPLYVPNAIFTTISVENPSRMRNRRIKTLIGVRYRDAEKVEEIVTEIREMLEKHPKVDTELPLMVNLAHFGPSALEIMMYVFVTATRLVDFQNVQEDIFLKALDIIHRHDAECAYPTTTLHIPDELDIPMKTIVERGKKGSK